MHIDEIVFMANTVNAVNAVNSVAGQTFAEVENAFCRLIDETSGQESARCILSRGGPPTAHVIAKDPV